MHTYIHKHAYKWMSTNIALYLPTDLHPHIHTNIKYDCTRKCILLVTYIHTYIAYKWMSMFSKSKTISKTYFRILDRYLKRQKKRDAHMKYLTKPMMVILRSVATVDLSRICKQFSNNSKMTSIKYLQVVIFLKYIYIYFNKK